MADPVHDPSDHNPNLQHTATVADTEANIESLAFLLKLIAAVGISIIEFLILHGGTHLPFCSHYLLRYL